MPHHQHLLCMYGLMMRQEESAQWLNTLVQEVQKKKNTIFMNHCFTTFIYRSMQHIRLHSLH